MNRTFKISPTHKKVSEAAPVPVSGHLRPFFVSTKKSAAYLRHETRHRRDITKSKRDLN